MKKSTYRRCRVMVSTVKKSTASVLFACARRKAQLLGFSGTGERLYESSKASNRVNATHTGGSGDQCVRV
jgi:hypothetical protein